MAIEFKARVLLELGAELISSDAVAYYELIKNAIDARSHSVAANRGGSTRSLDSS
jgi:hypothetical protein